MKYSFENKNPLWHTHEGLVPKTNGIVVNDRIIKVYPDNNGGLWYWHPETGEKVVIS